MRDLLTPKQVARAINVSESSVKRWCDKGVIDTQYTAGGHRRIRLSSLLDFLRAGSHELVAPEVLGLPATSGRTTRVLERSRDEFVRALIAGNEQACRQITLDLYLAEHSVSKICDELFAESFHAIGDLWECGQAEVFEERRGCEVTLSVLRELRSMVASPSERAPVAIGAAGPSDQYSLGTTMAELVLRDAGWNAASLGDNLPFETLGAAIKKYQPRLFWLSCSHIEAEAEFLSGYHQIYEEFGMGTAFVVGGRALTPELRQHMKFAAYCDDMQHLESFAQSLHSALSSDGERNRE